MYSSSNVTKVIVYAAVIGGVFLLVNRFNTARKMEVEKVVTAISETAAILRESGGQDPERIASAIARIEDVSLGTIEKGIAKTDEGYAEYIAVELILRRIFELDRTAFLYSVIERRSNTPKSYPWTIEGETATIEPFELEPEEPGRVSYLFESFSSQGDPRKPWR